MSALTVELDSRLAALRDADSEFYRCTLQFIEELGLVEETLAMLNETPDASIEDVMAFRDSYVGAIEVYDDDGTRVPVGVSRLRLTSGMRGILAEMKGKTFKSYRYEPFCGAGDVADSNVRLNLGQHAIDLNCCGFVFEIGGQAVELGAVHCERMSLLDDFRAWSDGQMRTQLVGERVTGVELVSDHAEILRGGDTGVFDVDVAIVVRTVHAAYTFARESWRSMGIRVATADQVVLPYGPCEVDVGWLGLPEGCGVALGEVTRTVEKLA